MATMNPFNLLGDDAEDPSQFIAAVQEKPLDASAVPAAKKAPAPAQATKNASQAKLPSKPLPPAQAGNGFLSFFSLDVFFPIFITSL